MQVPLVPPGRDGGEPRAGNRHPVDVAGGDPGQPSHGVAGDPGRPGTLVIVHPVGDGVEIRIRAQPRASRSEVVGPYGDRAVKLRLAAPPVDGAANEELVRFLADLFGVSRSGVELVRGHGSRDKVVRIGGATEEEARARLGL